MNMRRSTKEAVILVVAFLAFIVVAGLFHASVDKRTLTNALNKQLDEHSTHIAAILYTMRGSDTFTIEDAAFLELEALPSSSLIVRSDIKIMTNGDSLQCVIDTSKFGIASRIIRPAPETNPKSDQ